MASGYTLYGTTVQVNKCSLVTRYACVVVMAEATPVGDLDQHLMVPQSQQLHNNGVTSASLPRYSGSDFLSGPRSLSDSSAAESPVGTDDLQTNGQTTFHHHIHHHNPATTYPSHYPVLPSLLYSQLYHHSGPDLLPSQPRDDQQHSRADQSAVWRPY